MSHISTEMERAGVRALASKAKSIPRGIVGNGFDRRVNIAVIKITSIFNGLGSVGLLIKVCLEVKHSRSSQYNGNVVK